MDRSAVFALTAAERRRAADMFGRLDEEQWAAQSLCTEWTVREVAAHLIGPFCISVPRFLAGAVLSGGLHTYSVKATRRLAQRPVPEIIAILRANAERTFVPPGTGPAAPLTDLAVHTRDVARPLGLPTTASPGAWRVVLDFLFSARAARGFVRRGRLGGLRLRGLGGRRGRRRRGFVRRHRLGHFGFLRGARLVGHQDRSSRSAGRCAMCGCSGPAYTFSLVSCFRASRLRGIMPLTAIRMTSSGRRVIICSKVRVRRPPG